MELCVSNKFSKYTTYSDEKQKLFLFPNGYTILVRLEKEFPQNSETVVVRVFDCRTAKKLNQFVITIFTYDSLNVFLGKILNRKSLYEEFSEHEKKIGSVLDYKKWVMEYKFVL